MQPNKILEVNLVRVESIWPVFVQQHGLLIVSCIVKPDTDIKQYHYCYYDDQKITIEQIESPSLRNIKMVKVFCNQALRKISLEQIQGLMNNVGQELKKEYKLFGLPKNISKSIAEQAYSKLRGIELQEFQN